MQFSLRTLLAATAVVCGLLGWKADQAYRQKRAVAAIVERGGRVGYEQEGLSRHEIAEHAAGLLGRDFLEHVSSVYWAGSPLSDADLDCLRRLPRLATLSLASTPITDDGLKRLAACPRLELVDVRFTQVTEAGVEALRRALPKTKVLRLNDAE